MKHYWSVYKEFFQTSISEAMSFRVNFVLILIMDLFFYATTFLSVIFIYDHIELIGPWNRDQLLFFIAFMLTIDHLHMVFLSESFWQFPEDIRMGMLDYILLKPVSSIFIVFFRHVRAASFLNFITTWGALIYLGTRVNLGLYDWIALPFLVFLSFVLLAIIEFIISTAMFWVIEGWGINFLRMQMQKLGQWPNFIYNRTAKRLMTFALPILLIGSAPVHFLYDASMWHMLVYMVVAVLVFGLLLNKIWSVALNRYESASS